MRKKKVQGDVEVPKKNVLKFVICISLKGYFESQNMVGEVEYLEKV